MSNKKMKWTQVRDALVANKETYLHNRLAVLEDGAGDTFGDSIIVRPDSIEYATSLGTVVAVGEGYKGKEKVGQKVRYNRYAKLTFEYETDHGSFSIVVVPHEDVYVRVEK